MKHKVFIAQPIAILEDGTFGIVLTVNLNNEDLQKFLKKIQKDFSLEVNLIE